MVEGGSKNDADALILPSKALPRSLQYIVSKTKSLGARRPPPASRECEGVLPRLHNYGAVLAVILFEHKLIVASFFLLFLESYLSIAYESTVFILLDAINVMSTTLSSNSLRSGGVSSDYFRRTLELTERSQRPLLQRVWPAGYTCAWATAMARVHQVVAAFTRIFERERLSKALAHEVTPLGTARLLRIYEDQLARSAPPGAVHACGKELEIAHVLARFMGLMALSAAYTLVSMLLSKANSYVCRNLRGNLRGGFVSLMLLRYFNQPMDVLDTKRPGQYCTIVWEQAQEAAAAIDNLIDSTLPPLFALLCARGAVTGGAGRTGRARRLELDFTGMSRAALVVALLPLPLKVVSSVAIQYKLHRKQHTGLRARSNVTSQLTDSLARCKLAKLYSAVPYEIVEVSRRISRHTHTLASRVAYRTLQDILSKAVGFYHRNVTKLYGVLCVATGRLTLNEAKLFSMFVSTVYRETTRLSNSVIAGADIYEHLSIIGSMLAAEQEADVVEDSPVGAPRWARRCAPRSSTNDTRFLPNLAYGYVLLARFRYLSSRGDDAYVEGSADSDDDGGGCCGSGTGGGRRSAKKPRRKPHRRARGGSVVGTFRKLAARTRRRFADRGDTFQADDSDTSDLSLRPRTGHAPQAPGAPQAAGTPLGLGELPVPLDIELVDVSFRYPQASPMVLENMSIHIAPGQRIALVGHSGNGKSTIASMLVRLYTATRGRVLLNGQPIAAYPLDYLRRHIAVLLQDSLLISGSAYQNILYGLTADELRGANAESLKRVARECARMACIDDFLGGYGYEKVLAPLSGGQKQRLCIARSLAKAVIRGSSVVVLDEATSALDEETENRVTANIFSFFGPAHTVIIIAHRISTIRKADVIYVMGRPGGAAGPGSAGGAVSSDGAQDRADTCREEDPSAATPALNALELKSVLSEPALAQKAGECLSFAPRLLKDPKKRGRRAAAAHLSPAHPEPAVPAAPGSCVVESGTHEDLILFGRVYPALCRSLQEATAAKAAGAAAAAPDQ